MEHLKTICKRLLEAGLNVHPRKCVFGADSIDFPGHRISAEKLEPHQDKLAAVRDLLSSIDISSLLVALGLFSYYIFFLLHFSFIAFPLDSLLRKDRPYECGAAQESALELKGKLCTATVCGNLTTIVPSF